MKENINLYFDKIFRLKGANILYPVIAIFCWFFYFAYFGQGMEFQKLDSETPNWPFWFILSCISFGLINIWCYQNNFITKRLVAINSFVYTLSFFMIEYKLYHILPALVYMEVIICFFCVFKAFRTPLNIKRNWLWLYPIVFIAIYHISPTIIEVIISTVVSLAFLTFYEATGIRSRKYLLSLSAIGVYVITIFVYCPYNPILSYKNIQSINVSYNPKGTSLIIKDNEKYAFINGLSLCGDKLINVEFDTIAQINPYLSLFGGFKIENACNFKAFEQIPSELSPIIIRGNFAYFSSQKSVYDVLTKCINSKAGIKSITAKLYYNYINLCARNDSINQDIILKNSQELQDSILKSLNIKNLRGGSQDGAEVTLRQISKKLSLGMLNALSMDLLTDGDYLSALKIFSYQFFLTFYDTDIYKQITTNFNVELNKSYGTEQSLKNFRIKDSDLKAVDTFEPWTQVFSMSVTFAEALLIENYNSKQTETISKLKSIIENRESHSVFDIQSTVQFKEDLNDIFNSLSNYGGSPNLTYFTSQIQHFFYNCVFSDVYPDYNSFFLNRFNEVSPMIPLNPMSEESYGKFKELYNSRFDKYIKEVKEMASLFGQLQDTADSTITRQKELNRIFQSLNLDNDIKQMIERALTNNKFHE